MITTPSARRMFGAVLVLAGLLPAIGFALLPAIGWPDIAQGASAAEALPRIAADPAAFRLGFGAMVAGGVLFIPAAAWVLILLRAAGGTTPLFVVTALFAIASGTLRTLWYAMSLTTFPVLQRLWDGGDESTRRAVDVFYIAVNDVLSTVQEDIGVNVFGGVFLVLVAVLAVRTRGLPVWAAVVAAVAGLSFLVSSSELVGIANGPVVPIIGPVVSALWLIAVGVLQLLPPSVGRVPAAHRPAVGGRNPAR